MQVARPQGSEVLISLASNRSCICSQMVEAVENQADEFRFSLPYNDDVSVTQGFWAKSDMRKELSQS